MIKSKKKSAKMLEALWWKRPLLRISTQVFRKLKKTQAILNQKRKKKKDRCSTHPWISIMLHKIRSSRLSLGASSIRSIRCSSCFLTKSRVDSISAENAWWL